jgi:hypothetical protein
MNGTKMTEYTFEFKGTVTVNLNGSDTDANYQKAVEEAIKQAKNEIDHDWIHDNTAEEFIDYEKEEA